MEIEGSNPFGVATSTLRLIPSSGQLRTGCVIERNRTHNEHEVYDPATDTWTMAQPLLTPRHGLASQSAGARLYAIAGGETPGFSVTGIVESYPH